MTDRPLSRRGLLKLGALGTAGIATGGGSLLLGRPRAEAQDHGRLADAYPLPLPPVPMANTDPGRSHDHQSGSNPVASGTMRDPRTATA